MQRLSCILFVILLLCATAQFGRAQFTCKPEDVKWEKPAATFTAAQLTPGKYAKVVRDAAAIGGKAMTVTAGEGRDSDIFSGGWAPVKTDAKYAVAFRLRMRMGEVAVTKEAHAIYVGTEGQAAAFFMPNAVRLEAIYRAKRDDPATESVLQWYFINAPDLDSVKDYHDYVIRFERPLPGFVGFRAYWYGRAFCSVWVDQVRLQEEPLPAEADELKTTTLDGQVTVRHDHPCTLVYSGPYNWTYHIPDCLGGKCELLGKPFFGDGCPAEPFPETPDRPGEI